MICVDNLNGMKIKHYLQRKIKIKNKNYILLFVSMYTYLYVYIFLNKTDSSCSKTFRMTKRNKIYGRNKKKREFVFCTFFPLHEKINRKRWGGGEMYGAQKWLAKKKKVPSIALRRVPGRLTNPIVNGVIDPFGQ